MLCSTATFPRPAGSHRRDLWLKNTIETRELTAEEAQALYDAAWRDIRAENVLPVDGDYAWLGVEITLFRDGDRYTISSTKSSYKELTQALLDLGTPCRTAVCVLADKEEIGSEGVSGMKSAAFDTFMEDLCAGQNVPLRACYEKSFCLSAT